MGIKNYLNKKVDEFKVDNAERQQFNKKLNTIKRDAYRKQLLKETKRQAVKSAKDKFKKKPAQNNNMFGNSAPSKGKGKKPYEIDFGF